ncbi:hypothetical protein AVEN_272119-1 [Araneus ventricosus]|uniref:Uncharacterized protein n=1 Tax=Araneus ventricosus TaxID=182803 RepID=A0A4Y2K945_ARAVE|nr:hypothetical protein AVEN_272119-1 [Araneus ventricosus]
MAYRATPLENGFSPSELLMGRKINTTLPVAKTQLQPYSVNKKVLEAKEERQIEGQKTNYDKHHGVRNLDELDPGQNVWITDRRVTGKVLQKTPYPRSYLVQSGRRVYRRIVGWLVVWGLMAQEPFLAKLRQSNVKNQHSGTKNLKFSENVKRKLFERKQTN